MIGTRFLALGIVLAAGRLDSQAHDTAAVVALTNATVIDGTGAPAKPGRTILIRNGRIIRVAPVKDRPIPPGAAVRDLTGRYVIPGLIDAHMHLAPLARTSRERLEWELDRMLRGGIVAVRVMAGPPALHTQVKRAASAGRISSPDIHFAVVMAGPHFMDSDTRVNRFMRGDSTAGGPPPAPRGITDSTDLAAVIADAVAAGASAVKLYAGLDATLMRRITDEAHRQGLKVWAHATVFPDRPIATVHAGVDGASHVCSLAWQDADLHPSRFTEVSDRQRPTFDPGLVDADSPEMRLLFDEMARRRTIFDPTLLVQSRAAIERIGCSAPLMVALARAAHRAGVPIAAGTDFVADTADPYPALHQELELLVSSGVLTPMEAITAATLNGARALGLEATLGSIEEGKVASLVILDADPSADIRALRTVMAVVKRGKMFPRAR